MPDLAEDALAAEIGKIDAIQFVRRWQIVQHCAASVVIVTMEPHSECTQARIR